MVSPPAQVLACCSLAFHNKTPPTPPRTTPLTMSAGGPQRRTGRRRGRWRGGAPSVVRDFPLDDVEPPAALVVLEVAGLAIERDGARAVGGHALSLLHGEAEALAAPRVVGVARPAVELRRLPRVRRGSRAVGVQRAQARAGVQEPVVARATKQLGGAGRVDGHA